MILTHGEDAIFQAGIDCFGYPGTWVTDRDEAMELETFLASNQEGGEIEP